MAVTALHWFGSNLFWRADKAIDCWLLSFRLGLGSICVQNWSPPVSPHIWEENEQNVICKKSDHRFGANLLGRDAKAVSITGQNVFPGMIGFWPTSCTVWYRQLCYHFAKSASVEFKACVVPCRSLATERWVTERSSRFVVIWTSGASSESAQDFCSLFTSAEAMQKTSIFLFAF